MLSFGSRLSSCGTSVARVGPLSRGRLARQAVEAHGGGIEPGMAGMEHGGGVGMDGVEQPWQADGPSTSDDLLASFKVSKAGFCPAARNRLARQQLLSAISAPSPTTADSSTTAVSRTWYMKRTASRSVPCVAYDCTGYCGSMFSIILLCD